MQLITKEFEALFNDYTLYSQDNTKDPLVIAKLFLGGTTWYLTEYDSNSKRAFCYIQGLHEDEF